MIYIIGNLFFYNLLCAKFALCKRVSYETKWKPCCMFEVQLDLKHYK